MDKPDGSRKGPPSRQRVVEQSDKKQLFEQLLQHGSGFVAKKVSRCKKSEMVAGNSESVAKKVNRLLKVVLNP